MSVRRLGGLFFAVLMTAAAVASAGEDWPQWGGTDSRNMVSDETKLPDGFTPGKKGSGGDGIDPATTENVKWTARLGSCAYGNPTVADGRVFVGTDDVTLAEDSRFERSDAGLVKCFDEQTGQLVWQLVTPKRTNLPENAHYGHQFLGVCSSPTVDGDRVYIISPADELLCLDVDGLADGNDGPFQDEAHYMAGAGKPPVELNEHDADIIWRYDLIDELGVVPHDVASCSVLVHGPVVYTGTSNGVDKSHENVVNPQAPSLIALDKMTGRLVAVDGEKIGTRLYHCQWSAPSLGQVNGQTLIFFGGGDGVCYAFEAIDSPSLRPQAGEGPGVRAITSANATDPTISTRTLKKVWSYDCNPPEYKFRDGRPISYYDGDKRKKRGNTNDGTYVGPSQIIATPVFHEGRVYVPIGQDPAHGLGRGMLHSIDATKTGDITRSGRVWAFDGIQRSLSTVAIADGVLYAADVAGTLYALDVDTGKPLWKYEANAETWGGPLVADGKIYWGTKRHFYIFTAGPKPTLLNKIYLGSPVYTTSIAASGVVYVTSQRYLWAVEQTPSAIARAGK